jgi:hypothetical protein
MGLDGIDDEAVVVAVDSGLHQHAALEASRPVHREVIFQEHRWWGEKPRGGTGILFLGTEHMGVAVSRLGRQLQRRFAHVQLRSGAHRGLGGTRLRSS